MHYPVRGRMRTILVVDDSRTNLHSLGQQLQQHGHMVVLSDGGAEALDMIAARGFDIVLLDMMMPGISGLHVLGEIRGNRETADLPVIMVTGRNDTEAAIQALAAGADDHIAKPFEFAVLAARIERVLARAQRIAELKRSNAALDARIAARAIELGEARDELADSRAEQVRLLASITDLNERIARFSA